MSQIALTNADRISAIEYFGYTPHEASFLVLAALHGGYFLRRQYARFLGRQDGGTVTQLVERGVGLNHLSASTLRQNTLLYHLSSRPFYEALGQGENRNRRRRELTTAKNKIMGLDFVLDHPGSIYLATEQEKLDYFTKNVNVDAAKLPAKIYHGIQSSTSTVRYFLEKYPIFLAPPRQDGSASVVSFCFIDEGLSTLSRFETFSKGYQPLFESVPELGLIYVADTPRHFEGAGAFARRFGMSLARLDAEAAKRKTERLLEYFQTRRLYEARQFSALDRAKLIRFRDAKTEFAGAAMDTLFDRWKSAGPDVVRQFLTSESDVESRIRRTFSTHLLEQDYGAFGGAGCA